MQTMHRGLLHMEIGIGTEVSEETCQECVTGIYGVVTYTKSWDCFFCVQ